MPMLRFTPPTTAREPDGTPATGTAIGSGREARFHLFTTFPLRQPLSHPACYRAPNNSPLAPWLPLIFLLRTKPCRC